MAPKEIYNLKYISNSMQENCLCEAKKSKTNHFRIPKDVSVDSHC